MGVMEDGYYVPTGHIPGHKMPDRRNRLYTKLMLPRMFQQQVQHVIRECRVGREGQVIGENERGVLPVDGAHQSRLPNAVDGQSFVHQSTRSQNRSVSRRVPTGFYAAGFRVDT